MVGLAGERDGRDDRWTVLAILAAGLLARAAAFSPYAINHPDEAIQYLEQAHRLTFGSGVMPWEYRLGMRSWLVPLLLAGPMWLGDRIAPASLLYVILPRLLCAAIALAPLWAAYRIGRQLSRRHALVALAVLTLWPESVYFSVHVLTETLSVAMFLPAAALLTGERTRGRVVAAGALLGLAVIFRFHYAPAAAVLVAFGLRRRWREWRWLALGAVAPTLASGAIDLAMGQWPFAWMVNNLRYNIVEHRAASFGEFGPQAYLQMLWASWSIALAPIVWLAWYGARRFPALGWATVANLAVHLLIGHKEYRFILLSVQLAMLLAAIGTVEVVDALPPDATGWRSRSRVLLAALLAWGVVATVFATSDLADPGWRRYAAAYRLAREAHLRGACGMAIFAGHTWPPEGQTFLHGPTPVYYFNGPTPHREAQLVAGAASAFNAAVAPPGRASVPAAYRQVACLGDPAPERLCLAMRPGACTASAAANRQLMQRVMTINGY